MMQHTVAVVGSSNTDMIVQLPRMPRPGETLLGGRFQSAAGGKGANQAVAAARAGGHVSLIARVGQDSLGDQAIAGLVSDGIDVSQVTRDARSPSGVALIFVARNGENCIAVAGGANARLSPADISKARPLITQARALLLQLETPPATVEAAARIAAKSGTLVILNPAPARPLTDDLLRRVSILTPNESEAELLTGIRIHGAASEAKAAVKLLRRGVQAVVITLGARGALVANEEGTRLVKGFKVKTVDSTAAGDTFNGALAVALTEGRTLNEAVLFANAAAALSVTSVGAQPSAPTRSAIEKFLRMR